MMMFVLVGAIINVVVAWACAVNVTPYGKPVVSGWVVEDHEYWSASHRAGSGIALTISSRARWPQLKPRASTTIHPEKIIPSFGGLDSGVLESRILRTSGWPYPSMWCESDVKAAYGLDDHIRLGKRFDGSLQDSVRGGIATALRPWNVGCSKHLRVLPCRPIWTGFGVNTILYAGMSWLLLGAPLVPGRIRRWRRLRRGLCAGCGYPVGESNVCSECGKPVALKGVALT
ncbi:MAG: hypothetical protein L0Y42_03500 [Phycisphaerales bacterium]|nr:hypothetical protein [Phycisphaerales bacterium]